MSVQFKFNAVVILPVADTSFEETVVTAVASYALVCNRHSYEHPFGLPRTAGYLATSAFAVRAEWTTS